MSTGTELSRAGFEGPVMKAEDDRYGFTKVAEGLASSICALDENISTVIGIEGRWGSGKTSLLNLLVAQLKALQSDKTVVLPFSPWLSSPDESPVTSLLLTVAARLAEIDTSHKDKTNKISPLVQNVLNYTQQTSRRLAPLADFAGEFIPGGGIVAKGMKAFSETDLSSRRKTTSELRSEIELKIAGLGVNFIILIDDLDRLEPAQAVEVLRMVRSVADFSCFRYVMCYDRNVLAHAVEKGLYVQNGLQYLQKIIPLSFNLPRPESFDLRREFLSGVVRLYQSAHQTDPDDTFIRDLKMVTDIYGSSLQTPREVQLALNALAFRYNGVRDYVYLPDMSFLQIIRTTNEGLYDWIEEYLTERAVVESGDGAVSEAEQTEMANLLIHYLSLYRSTEARSVSSLSLWVPGILGSKIESMELFRRSNDDMKATLTANRRLGSDAYWRYYFAYSSPQNILPPDYFDSLFRQAGCPTEHSALAKELLSRISSNNVSSRTWFEHILSQLTWPVIATHSAEECAGLLRFFFEYGDDVIARYTDRNEWFDPDNLDTNGVAKRLLQRMCEDKTYPLLDNLGVMLETGKAWRWIADYFRQLLRMYGLTGNCTLYEQKPLLTTEALEALRNRLALRLNSPEITHQFERGELFLGHVWAWRDISGIESVRTWFVKASVEDEVFLKLLLALRYQGVNSATGYFRALSLSQVKEFIGDTDAINERLKQIEIRGTLADLLAQVREAITRNLF